MRKESIHTFKYQFKFNQALFSFRKLIKEKVKRKLVKEKMILHTTEIEIHINLLTIGMINIYKMLKKRKMEVEFWAVAILQPPVLTH